MMQRIRNLFGIGHVTLIDDTGDLQLIQVTEGAEGKGFAARVTDKVRRVMEFGFSSVPPLGSEVLLARRAGDRAHSTAVATNHRPSRMRNLKPGDVALYDVRGAYIWFTENGIIIDAAGLPVTVRNTTKLRVEAELIECTGDVVSRADGTPVSLNGLRDAYHAHKHTGVQAGGASTGLTDHDA